MAHEHSHAEDVSAYYLEQLCTIGICGLLGGVSVMLYHQGVLIYILHPKFHDFVLAGGIVVLALVVLRAIALWFEAGKLKAAGAHVHNHDHGHEHHHHHGHDHAHGEAAGHDHGHHHHDHAHEHHDHAHHDHGHEHGHHHHHDHAHTHSHEHDGHGHSHGWNPWRYILLMLPIVLYFLNLPNSGFSADRISQGINTGELEAVKGISVENAGFRIDRNSAGDQLVVVSLTQDGPAAQAGLAINDVIDSFTLLTMDGGKELDKPIVISGKGEKPSEVASKAAGKPGDKLKLTIHREGEGSKDTLVTRKADLITPTFPELVEAAYRPDRRERYQGKIAKAKGQLLLTPATDKVANLARIRVACCAADATTLSVPIVLDPNAAAGFRGIKSGEWFEVQGEIQFQKRVDRKNQDEYVTVLQVHSLADVVSTKPEPSPYLTSQ